MPNANYLAHFGTKGQKHGLRRHQSYETAPTRSGMVGQEVGEAARQSERLNRRDEQDDRNGPRRGPVKYEAKPSYDSPSDLAKASKKQTLKEKLRAKKAEKDAQNVEKNKAKWATNYKDLEAHKDAFTNRELEYALNRLNLTNRIKSDRLEQTRNLSQKGADTMRNLANASKSFVDIYNVVAGGYNTYQNYKSNKANKVDLMPKWYAGSGTYNINDQNNNNQNNNNQQHKKDNNQKKPKTINTRRGRFRGHVDHSGMSADDYIAHFGVPGQQWFKRHFQSYKTAPTRSGKVGEEIGLAAKQAERLGEDEKTDFMSDTTKKSDGSFECKLPKDSDMSFDSGGSERAKSFYDKYDAHRKKIIKSIADNYEKEYARDNLKRPLTQSQAFDNSIAMGLAWRKCKDSLEKSGMTVTVPSEKGWPLQITMDGGDIYGGHMLTFEYDDRKKKITKTGIAVEG